MLAINKTYTRIAPNGDKTLVKINNQSELEYHRSLIPHGFEYEPKLVIHNRLEECQSCSA